MKNQRYLKLFNILINCIGLLVLFSCNPKNYIAEKCSILTSIPETNTFKINDTLSGFSAISSENKTFDFEQLNRDKTFVFFKTEKHQSGGLINEEITFKDLGKLAKSKHVDLLIGLDSKLAQTYGAELINGKVTTSMLIITDKSKIIQEIYTNVCEEDIYEMISKI